MWNAEYVLAICLGVGLSALIMALTHLGVVLYDWRIKRQWVRSLEFVCYTSDEEGELTAHVNLEAARKYLAQKT